jgi:hypothetical protein
MAGLYPGKRRLPAFSIVRLAWLLEGALEVVSIRLYVGFYMVDQDAPKSPRLGTIFWGAQPDNRQKDDAT